MKNSHYNAPPIINNVNSITNNDTSMTENNTDNTNADNNTITSIDITAQIPNCKKLSHIVQNMKYKDQFPRLVGGCVRNILLKKAIDDIDITTPAPPEIIMEQIKQLDGQAIPTGLQHGTVTGVFYYNDTKITIEFTTLRIDLKCDGRHAKVQFTNNFKEDARRRDLTINAMSYCLIKKQLFDYFNGYKDLKNNIIKFIDDPYKRIHEDYLRILRFFRFAAYYGVKKQNKYMTDKHKIQQTDLNYKLQIIDSNTSTSPYTNIQLQLDQISYKACIELCHNISQLSQERITNEISKLIIGPYKIQTLKIMTPILKYFNINKENIALLKQMPKTTVTTALSLLFYNQYQHLLTMKLSKKTLRNIKNIQEILHIVDIKNTTNTSIKANSNHKIKTLQHKNQHKNLILNDEKFFYLKKIALKKNEIYINIIAILHNFKFINSRQIKLLNNLYYSNHQFPVNGHDLIKLGYQGQEISNAMAKLEKIWIESNGLTTKNELLSNQKFINKVK